jgi:hypothetical protein
MQARLSRWAGLPPERLHQTVDEFRERSLPVLKQQEGFNGVLVMIDENAGKAAAVTFWQDRHALRASERLAEQMRAQAEQTAGYRREREPIVDHYEVVMNETT